MGLDRAIDITAEQRKTVLALIKRHLPNTTAWVYGSRAKWTSRPQSDLDMVVFATSEQNGQVADLREALEESDLPFQVDLFVWDSVPEQFRKRIEREHVVLAAASDEPFSGRRSSVVVDEWADATVDDIAASSRNALVGGPFGSNLVSRDYVSQGVPVIRGQNMGTRWVSGDFVFVAPQKAESLKANLARPGDIVLTQRGTLGQVSLVPSIPFGRYLVSQSQMKLTVNRDIADPLFFYYMLSSAEQQDYVHQNAIQTGVPHTNLGILRSTPVPVPPLKVQHAIAHILGTLDDKIELNRRTNETLEAMARALFKSWFVNFDPVRAKMQGRDIGLPKHIADLFPDRLVDSELGEIPEGWELATLGDETSVTKGRSYKSSELMECDTALVTLKSFLRGGGYRRDGLKPYIGRYKDTQTVAAGDLIVAYTDVTQAAEVIGKPALVEHDPRYDRLVASLDVGIVRPTSADVSVDFLYSLLESEAFQAHAYARSTGTTVLHLSKTALPSYQFVRPPPGVLSVFNELVGPLRSRARANREQDLNLRQTRDTLLPRLVSGELRVNALEATAGLNVDAVPESSAAHEA